MKLKKIVLKAESLPDFELATNKEFGLNPSYLSNEFSNFLYGLLSFKEIHYIDYCYIGIDKNLHLEIVIALEPAIKNAISNYIEKSQLKQSYKLSLTENPYYLELANVEDFDSTYVRNHTVNFENRAINDILSELNVEVPGSPYETNLYYEHQYDIKENNDYTFLPEILLSSNKHNRNHQSVNGFILRVWNSLNINNNAFNNTHNILLNIYYFIKQIDSANFDNLGYDNPVKTLIEPASEWIDKLTEDFDSPKIAYHDIVFFSNMKGNARFIGEFIMSKLSENRFYSMARLPKNEFRDFLRHGSKLLHSDFRNFLNILEEKGEETGLEAIDNDENSSTELYIRNYLSTLRPIEELAPACRFIMPTHGAVKGIPLESFPSPEDKSKSIYIGYDEHSEYEAKIPLENLKKNTFVTGVPGSGKTTVLLSILSQLSVISLQNPSKPLNFICFEPAKTEFRSLFALTNNGNTQTNSQSKNLHDLRKNLNEVTDSLRIYSPGNDDFAPFTFNPFIIPAGVSVESHIKSLQKAFESALPMVGPVAGLVRKTLYKLYEGDNVQEMIASDRQYLFKDMGAFKYNEVIQKNETRSFPDILQFKNLLNRLIEDDYKNAGDVKDKIKAFVNNRISSFTTPGMQRIFYTSQNSFGTVEDLLNHKVIVEMDALDEDESNLITMFLLSQLRNVIRTRQLNSDFNYLILLEEAHNIVGTDIKQTGEETTNPKEIASKFVTKMMAEVRSYGVGLLISDQFPTAVDPMIVKNTSTKIAHRVISEEDKEKLADSMLLTEAQKEKLTASTPGESFIFMEKWLKPLKIKEPHFKQLFNIEHDFHYSTLKENFINKAKKPGWLALAEKIKKSVMDKVGEDEDAEKNKKLQAKYDIAKRKSEDERASTL